MFLPLSPDGVDGKQARRTNSSTPLGELFDHGLDSWACVYFVVTVYSTFGRGSTGVSVFVLYLLLWVVLFSFILSHWEKYNTGILFLPWGYDISQVVSTRPDNLLGAVLPTEGCSAVDPKPCKSWNQSMEMDSPRQTRLEGWTWPWLSSPWFLRALPSRIVALDSSLHGTSVGKLKPGSLGCLLAPPGSGPKTQQR